MNTLHELKGIRADIEAVAISCKDGPNGVRYEWIARLDAAIAALEAGQSADWVLVPRELTPAMWKAWEQSHMVSESYQEDYAAMLAAAPQQPPPQPAPSVSEGPRYSFGPDKSWVHADLSRDPGYGTTLVPEPAAIHSCTYECERPACIRAQRDELASRLSAASGEGLPREVDEALEELENGYEPAGVATDYVATIRAYIRRLTTTTTGQADELAAWRELADHVRTGVQIWPGRYTDNRTRDVAEFIRQHQDSTGQGDVESQ